MVLACAAVGGWPQWAVGQIAAAPNTSASSADEDGGLAEIVVTAQKRAQSIFDIPASISAVSGDELANRHIAGFEDLSRSTPGLSFSAGGSGFGAGEGNTTIQMRGISSSTGSASSKRLIQATKAGLDRERNIRTAIATDSAPRIRMVGIAGKTRGRGRV